MDSGRLYCRSPGSELSFTASGDRCIHCVRKRGHRDHSVYPVCLPSGCAENRRQLQTSPSSSSVQSLFAHCLNWLAKHVHLVDSLCGLPEIIGQQLFEATVEAHGVSMSNRAIGLFVSAYPGAFLDSFVSSYAISTAGLDILRTASSSLRCICLHRCGLTDGTVSGLGDHPRITELRLSCNRLSDVGVQKLTARQRFSRAGLQNLRCLDLAGKPVSCPDSCV